MGVNTKGAISEKVTGWDVYDFIKQSIDKNVQHYLRNGYDGREEGFIEFQYNNEDREIFFCVTNDPIYGINEESRQNYSRLLLNAWGSSVEIMERIVANFGGYVRVNDCVGERYYEVEKIESSEFEEYSGKRKAIIEILNDNFTIAEKNRIARELIDNKEQIMNALNKI